VKEEKNSVEIGFDDKDDDIPFCGNKMVRISSTGWRQRYAVRLQSFVRPASVAAIASAWSL
jgi:hypothetical protein